MKVRNMKFSSLEKTEEENEREALLTIGELYNV
jgi:hypothetical protein